MRRRNSDRPQLVQADNRDPKFIMALQNQHHLVALFDSCSFEEVCCLARQPADIIKCKNLFFICVICPQQRALFRLFFCQLIHYVKGEIKIFRYKGLEIFRKIFVTRKSCRAGFFVYPHVRPHFEIIAKNLQGFPSSARIACGVEASK